MESLSLGSLAVWRHTPETIPLLGRFLLVHGISEHSGRHLNTVNFLTSLGFEVIRFDLRGSGQSGGRRQWVKDFGDYVEDTATVFRWIGRELSDLPLGLLGHSLGGAIAIHFASEYGPFLNGLVLSAPAYLVGGEVPAWKIKIGSKLAPLLPYMPVPNSGDFSGVSRDPEVVLAYKNDPLAFHFNTLQQGHEVLKALPRVKDLAERISVPTFLVHGTSDRIIRIEGSFEILQRLRSKNKTMHCVPGGFHEPHNDFDREAYYAALRFWLKGVFPSNTVLSRGRQKHSSRKQPHDQA